MKKIIINECKEKELALVKVEKGNFHEYVIVSHLVKDNNGQIKYWNSGTYYGQEFKQATQKYFERLEK